VRPGVGHVGNAVASVIEGYRSDRTLKQGGPGIILLPGRPGLAGPGLSGFCPQRVVSLGPLL